MSKKAKAEIADESAVIITDAVLAENQAKLDSYEKSIKAAQERRRKVIMESKLYTHDKLSQLYGGAEGQALLDAGYKRTHFSEIICHTSPGVIQEIYIFCHPDTNLFFTRLSVP